MTLPKLSHLQFEILLGIGGSGWTPDLQDPRRSQGGRGPLPDAQPRGEGGPLRDRVGADVAGGEGTIEGRLATGEPWRLTVSLIEPAASDEIEAGPLNAYLAELSVHGDDGRMLRLKTLKLGP